MNLFNNTMQNEKKSVQVTFSCTLLKEKQFPVLKFNRKLLKDVNIFLP